MLSYILLTYLLCCIGWILYKFLIRKKLSSKSQRFALLSILLFSFAIPLFFVQNASPIALVSNDHSTPDTYILEESIFVDFCPIGEVLEACYQQAITSDEFCECDNISKDNLLVYQDQAFYNFLSWQESAFWKIMAGGAVVLFLLIVLNIGYLINLIRSSRVEKRNIEGKAFNILYPNKELSVASFKLLKPYIIWQKEMDGLSESETDAILSHEITHITQGDTWVKLMVSLMQILWFINPFYYFIKKELNHLSEYIADEVAVTKMGNAKEYASLLLKMKTNQKLAMAHAFSEKSILKDRIKHILAKQKKGNPMVNLLGISLIALLFCGISQTAYPLLDQQIDKLKIYQTLGEESVKTGRTTFCKKCMQKELEEACFE